MSVKATSTLDPPACSQGAFQSITQSKTDDKVLSFMAKGEDLLSYKNSLSLKTQHQIIPITECVSLDTSSFEKFYAQYQEKYLYFCENGLDLANIRVALALEASKKGLQNDVAMHCAVALNWKVAGTLEMSSLVAMQALKIGLYPMIISLGRDVRPVDNGPQHDVLIVCDEEIDVEKIERLRKRIGSNFYCFVKQLNVSMVIDPTLDHLIISKDLEHNMAYKKQLSSIKATKIYKTIIVKSPYDHLKSFLDQLLEDSHLLERNMGVFFQPCSRSVREKWCELVLKQINVLFATQRIEWTRETGSLGVLCKVDKDAAKIVIELLLKMKIDFSSSQKSDFMEIHISCYEIKEWRMLHETLKTPL